MFLPLLAVLIVIGAAVMGSPVRGGLVVLAGTLLLGVVGAILALILRGVAAIPIPVSVLSRVPLLGMARRNLKRRTLESAFATTGLSVGVFAIGLAVAAWLGARTQLLKRTEGADASVRVNVIASRADSSRVVAMMIAAGTRAAGTPTIPATVPAGGRGIMQGAQVPDSAITMTISVPAASADGVTDELASTLPNALVFTDRDVNDFIIGVYRGLFAFAVALAGLAVIMGLVLLANVISLAMQERRREHAVLKAIGYSRMAVMRLVLVEQTLIGVVAGGTGLAAVVVVREVVNAMEPRAHFTLPAGAMIALLVGCGLLTTLAAAFVAGSALRTRPLVVLRGE
jgi:putative ABC transport system permease protein